MKLQQISEAVRLFARLPQSFVIAALALATPALADQVTSPQPAHSGPSTTAATAAQTVDDGDPGWIWSGMEDYSDPELHATTGHAGGPGSYGAYTFNGVGVDIYGLSAPGASVNGRIHKVGTVKVSLDGSVSGEYVEKNSDTTYGYLIARIDGLPDGNHVLQVAPEGGWGVVDYIVVHKTSLGADAVRAQEARPLVPAGYYRIIPRNAPDKCLDISDPSAPNGAQVQIYQPMDGHAEVWHVVPLGDEHYRLSPANAPDQAVSIDMITPALDDPPVILWRYSGDARQQMLIRPVGDGYFRLGPASDPDETMDVFYKGTDNGTKIIGYKWGGGPNQEWWLMGVAAPRK